MTVSKRKAIARVLFFALIIALAVAMFRCGRQHTVLVDNHSSDTLKALKLAEVSVDGQESIELTPRGRDQFIVTAQKHSVTVEADGKSVTRSFSVPLSWDYAMVNVPYLAANPDAPVSEWLSEFTVVQQVEEASPEDNQVETGDSFSV